MLCTNICFFFYIYFKYTFILFYPLLFCLDLVDSQKIQSTDTTDGSESTKTTTVSEQVTIVDPDPVVVPPLEVELVVELEKEETVSPVKPTQVVAPEKKEELVQEEKEKSVAPAVVEAPLAISVVAPPPPPPIAVEPTPIKVTRSAKVSTTTKPVNVSRPTGSAVRSQGPKAAETASTATSSPSRTAAGLVRSNLPVRASSAPSPSTKSARSSVAVVNRARTVDLGKVSGRKLSDHQPPNRTIVRQMSTGGLMPSSPTSSPSNKPSSRPTNNGKLNLRMKADSPKRTLPVVKPTAEDSKKLSTAIANTNGTCSYLFIIISLCSFCVCLFVCGVVTALIWLYRRFCRCGAV